MLNLATVLRTVVRQAIECMCVLRQVRADVEIANSRRRLRRKSGRLRNNDRPRRELRSGDVHFHIGFSRINTCCVQ